MLILACEQGLVWNGPLSLWLCMQHGGLLTVFLAILRHCTQYRHSHSVQTFAPTSFGLMVTAVRGTTFVMGLPLKHHQLFDTCSTIIAVFCRLGTCAQYVSGGLAVWGVTLATFLMGLPLIEGVSAFSTCSSIATAGLCIDYAMPIGCRLLFAGDSFEPGPFSMGR